jgi:DNA-binding response OmpR family regulator
MMVHDHESLTQIALDRTVLVLDNSPAILELLHLVLQDRGYRVLTCQTATTALEHLRRTVPSLIILDAQFLDSSWSNIFDCLVDDKKIAGAPVLLTTDFPVKQLQNGALIERYGFPEIQKPFDIDELHEKAQQLQSPQALGSAS